MLIVGEYSDEAKSGKSVEGRPQFYQMLQDIETGKDNVDFVLVFKFRFPVFFDNQELYELDRDNESIVETELI